MIIVGPWQRCGDITVSGPVHYDTPEEGGYELLEDCWVEAPFLAGWSCRLDDGTGEQSDAGRITLHKGFKCDGPSAPLWLRLIPGVMTQNFLEASFFHDFGARVCRASKLDYRVWKPRYDRILVGVGEIKGMWLIKRKAIALAMHTDKAWNAFRPQPATPTVVHEAP